MAKSKEETSESAEKTSPATAAAVSAPVPQSKLHALAASVSASADNGSDDFVDLLVEQKDEVNQWLEHVGGTPEDPPPENPNENPTPEESKAWRDAWTLKHSAERATPHHEAAIARRVKKGKRKSGKPINGKEADAVAKSLIQTAKDQPMEDLAAALLESRQA